VVALWFCVLLAFQLVAQVFFKLGALHPEQKVLYWVLGNTPGATSMLIMIQLYRLMDANVAIALVGGAGFIAVQIGMAVIFRGNLTFGQCVAMAMIAAGMALFSLTAKPAVA
jgi:hypothetical protein